MQNSSKLQLEKEEAEQLVAVYLHSSSNLNLVYGKMFGYEPMSVMEDAEDLSWKVLFNTPEDVVETKAIRNIEKLVSNIEEQFFGSHWQEVFNANGFSDVVAQAAQEGVSEIRSKLISNRIRTFDGICDGFSFCDELISRTLDCWRSDFDRVCKKIDDRWEYLGPLLKRAALKTDKYGEADLSGITDELDEFIDHYFESSDFIFWYDKAPSIIFQPYVVSRLSAFGTDDIPENGIEFEHWCAERIDRQGWKVQVSQASGDQGVDIIAIRDGTKVAIQCKRYSQPVGNKAVQEAYSGSRFSDAQEACVIATAGYTRSARELAASTNVKLIDADNIAQFSEVFGFVSLDENSLEPNCAEYNERTVILDFETPIQGRAGGLLRSTMSSYPLDELNINNSTVTNVLTSIDEDSGLGSFECAPSEAVLLLMLVEVGLNGDFPVTEENLRAVTESELYDAPQIPKMNPGGVVPVSSLFSKDTLSGIEQALDFYAMLLPEPWINLADNLIAEQRNKRD